MSTETEIRTCLELLVQSCARSEAIALPDHPSLLVAVDKQLVERAKKALRAEGVRP